MKPLKGQEPPNDDLLEGATGGNAPQPPGSSRSAGPAPASAGSRPKEPPETLIFLGVPIANVTQEETLAWIRDRIEASERSHIVTANMDILLHAWRDPEMHRIQLEADLVLADGMPIVWLSGLFGPRIKQRVPGSDLVPSMAKMARERGWSLYAVGAGSGVAERAMKVLQEEHPGLQVAGWESPPQAPLHQMDHEGLLEKVRAAKPHILLAALGAPKQEKWIRLHYLDWAVPIAIGVGGSLDFLAGTQTRAPRWIQIIGMEWFWRLATNPKRLFKRYLFDAVYLAWMILRFAAVRLSPASTVKLWPGVDPEGLQARGAEWVKFAPLRGREAANAFFRANEDAARRRPLIVDLSAVTWLDSLELGCLVRLAKACRYAHHRLFLVGMGGRVERLLRLWKLDRYLGLLRTPEELELELKRLKSTTESKIIRLNRAHHRLRIVLPTEFTRDTAVKLRELFVSQWKAGVIREVVIDAREMSYIDSAGARLIMAIRRLIENDPARTMWLMGFPDDVLQTMKKEGMDTVRIDRRNTFRQSVFPSPE
jgi:N-acetylglucosaminyldiphosphoundecaprenol N-acetyl-beta-D-mannosaminyltransferase